ncbi:hypothetical protein [Aquimarina muelleri]|uniref:Uncharacterized protein n=1 Tax=Aquimarina muelleri TaxID=279356 RepID=A0A918JVS4_9FLAO|nr:hypothetical protein [Aquimarina muelleri]MCX2762750.1 hypothetical protein [Aquimarina muelleri]GGX18816.1 hypothetical protein GCM10007384_20200 [Aquimarina muelleri]
MKTEQTNPKYIEWRSPEELHETSLHWILELKFIKDEQHFLEELIENHTLELVSKIIFGKSKSIVEALSISKKNIKPLLKKITNHHNELTVLLDGVDQPIEEKKYKEEHRKLTIVVNEFFEEYREVKRDIFDLIKSILKQSKQKRLLD